MCRLRRKKRTNVFLSSFSSLVAFFFLRRWWQLDLHFKNTCPGCRRCFSSADTYILPYIRRVFGVKKDHWQLMKLENILSDNLSMIKAVFFLLFSTHSKKVARENECKATVLCGDITAKNPREEVCLINFYISRICNQRKNVYAALISCVGRLEKKAH